MMAARDPLHAFRRERECLILDGGLATELERRGADLNHPLWSARLLLENPAAIREMHLDYFRAGADVATTATYQASISGFARCGLARSEAERCMRRAVSLAREAREAFLEERVHSGLTPLVAGSAGCYGASLGDGSEYRGGYGMSEADLIAFHKPRFDVLLEAGVDLIAFETIPCLAEGEAIAVMLDEYPEARCWVSFTCGDDGHVREGQDIASCARVFRGMDSVVAVGVNCTAPGHVSPLLRSLADAAEVPLVAYPNSGETFDTGRRTWCAPDRSFDWTADAAEWFALGARLIGGCCRTTPDEIGRLRERLEAALA